MEASAGAGATSAMYVMLRMPLEVRDLFEEWLATDQPGRASRVMSLMRQVRNGRTYESSCNVRMAGRGPVAELVAQRFAAAVRRLGLDRPAPPLRVDLFRTPRPTSPQPDLFGDIG